MKQRVVLSIAAGLSLGFAGTAGAHFGDSKLVHGCIKNNGGATRIVGSNTNCASGEFAKHWAITGPAGPTGPKGNTGATGPQGPMGAPGSDGSAGPQGPAGSDGAQGSPGVDGATGAQGPAGADGQPGQPGQPGSMRLIDANGNTVGFVMGTDNNSINLLSEDLSSFYTVSADNNRFNSTPVLYYKTADCTGEPYLEASVTVKSRLIEFGTTGMLIKVPASTNTTVTINSYAVDDVTCNRLIFSHPLEQVEVIDSSTLPFAYPIQFPVTFDF